MTSSNTEFKKINSLENIIIFLFCILLSATISVYFGKDLSWDLANYHYYIPYAHLAHRELLDYWPISFVHLFFFPTADFFSFFLINYFNSFTVVFVMGALQGFNLWFTYLIANCFLKSKSLALLLSLLGIYSAHIFGKIGGFENDQLMSIFVLLFIFLQISTLLKFNQTILKEKRSYNFIKTNIVSGILLGIALSIKLTAGIYVVGGIFANFLLPLKLSDRSKSLILFLTAIFFTFVLISGYWMFLLWHNYQNPFFPFFNGIFHSSYFPLTNFHYTIFLPKTFLQIIFYPIYFSIYGTLGDQQFLDTRFAILFILFILFGLRALYLKFIDRSNEKLSVTQYWLFTFIIFSYIAWEYYFAIVRYIGVIALLAPLLIYLLLMNLIQHQYSRIYLLFLLYVYMICTMSLPINVRAPWYSHHYFNINLPAYIEEQNKSLVLIAYPAFALSNQPKPQSYLIPFFPKKWQFIGIPFNELSPAYLTNDERIHIQSIIDAYQDPIFLLATKETIPSFYLTLRDFGLVKNGPCQTITSDRQKMSNTETFICPVRKINSYVFNINS